MPVEERIGTVAELHALDPLDPLEHDGFVAAAVWWCRPTDDAIVLGSRQSESLVDPVACRRSGLAVVRRRSGGGAVIVRRASSLWVDVVVPTRVAPSDIRGSMVWIGEAWRDTLTPLVTSKLRVHLGGMQPSDWSDLVCFAGVGPGEVLNDGGKLVGLSQRRTRHGIRVQALVYAASVAHEYPLLLRGDLPEADPGGQSWLPDLDQAAVVAAFAERITARITPV
jgi:lipoate---protein ligase